MAETILTFEFGVLPPATGADILMRYEKQRVGSLTEPNCNYTLSFKVLSRVCWYYIFKFHTVVSPAGKRNCCVKSCSHAFLVLNRCNYEKQRMIHIYILLNNDIYLYIPLFFKYVTNF